ncbi:MAG: histidine kinase dimerization/phospho-acceptor domain-containing protein, partial [Acidimicrobiales bacterium]
MSLRLRLLLAVAVVALVALIGSDVATYSAFRSYLDGQLDATLQAAAAPIQRCLAAGGTLNVAIVHETDPQVFAEVRTRSGRVTSLVLAVDEDSHVEPRPALSRALAGIGTLRPPRVTGGPVSDECRSQRRIVPGNPQLGTNRGGSGNALFATIPGGPPDRPGYQIRASLLSNGAVLVLGLPLTETGNTLSRLLVIELGVSAAALLGALGLGAALVRLGVRPLVEVEQTAELIMEGDLAARVPENFKASTEMGRLTRVLNLMLGRIADDFEERDQTERALRRSEGRMRQFLADASHELRTPIAAVSAYAELFSSGADKRPGDLARILAGIQNETGRMSHLVADLMLLASLDEGRPLERYPVEL